MAGPLEPSGRRRSPVGARILAPIALLAVTVAVIMVVSASTDEESGGRAHGGGDSGGAGRTTKRTQQTERDRPPKTYVIEQGDSLIAIADEFGLTVERIERLNPDVDPQALVTGQELKLR